MLNRLLIVLLALALASFSVSAIAEPPVLKLYLWEDYLDPAIVKRFEREFSARINITTFDDDDQREETLLATQGKGFDIICLSDTYMHAPARLGWLAELDLQEIPNLRHVDDPFEQLLPEAKRYAVPYFWGTLGIAYRADLVDTPPVSWLDLFSRAPDYSGRVQQPSTMRLLVGIALLAAGKDFNSDKAADLQAASALLTQQVPHLFGYQTSDITGQNPLVTGAVAMAPMFNGDMLTIQNFNPQIRFTYPSEGAHVWVDYLAVSRDSPQRSLAVKFLNFLNDPEVALANARHVSYATPNIAARSMADNEYRNNPVIFPPAEVLRKAHLIRPLSAEALHTHTAIYVRTLSLFESLLERP